MRRPAPRAQARAGQGRRPGLHLLHPPRDRVLPARRPARARRHAPVPVDTGGYFDHTPHGIGARTSAARRSRMLEAMGISVEFSHHEGAPRPAGDRPALRRRADHRRQHHDLPARGQGGRARAGRLRDVHAQAVHRAPGSGMHTHLSLFEGDRNAFYEAGARVPAVQDRPRRSSPGCSRTRRRSPRSPTSGSTPTSGCCGGGEAPGVRLLGPQQPLRAGAGADVQARQGPVDAGSSSARSTPPATRTSPSRVLLAAGLKGIEEGYELPPRRRGRRLVAVRARAPRAGHRAAAAEPRRGDRA